MNVLLDRVRQSAVVADSSQKIVLSGSAAAGYRDFVDAFLDTGPAYHYDFLVELASDPTVWSIVNEATVAHTTYWDISYASSTIVGAPMSTYGEDPVVVSIVLTRNSIAQQVGRIPVYNIDNSTYLDDYLSGMLLVDTQSSYSTGLQIDPQNGFGPKVGFKATILRMGAGNPFISLTNSAYGKINGGTSSIATSALYQRLEVLCPLVDYEVVVKIL